MITRLPSSPLLRGVAVLGLLATAATASADILPADRLTTWNPGLPGGIPVRTTVCATVNASTYGNGASDASAGIQAALDACPVGQVVQLSAGIFTVNSSYLAITKGITLRGAGPGSTTLQKTNGAVPGSDVAADAQPIVIIGPNRWPKINESTARNLTADAVKGTFSVTVADAAGFAAGQFVLLDEDNYLTGAWTGLPSRNGSPTTAQIWATDRVVWQKHNPPEQFVDDPFPDSLTWFSRSGRPVNEIKEVASVSGSTITFTTPIHITYRASHTAQLTRWTGADVQVKNAGLEDLKVTGGGDGAIRLESAAYSWVRNVDDTVWLGEAVAIDFSFRCVVRDSYVHDGAWPSPGGGGYAVSLAFGSSEILIENNILMKANKVMVTRSAGAGSVVGYNYADDGFINYDLTWQEVGLNGSHMIGPHHMLFEGNESFNYDSDVTHGSAIYHTVFRNHLSGFRRSFTGLNNGRTAGLAYGSYWHSFVGNVLGVPGQMAGWLYEDPGDGTYGNAWGSAPNIWRLGYDPVHWEQSVDPRVKSTVIREGNFDYLTNQVHWDTAAQALPSSLYLAAKPAFFGSYTWPWVDPTGATKLYTLPARARFEAGTSYVLTVSRAGNGSGTVTSVPTGINCGATCSASYAAGSLVTLTAVPAAGSVLASWGGACSGATTCQVSMSAAQSVTATFSMAASVTVGLTAAASSVAESAGSVAVSVKVVTSAGTPLVSVVRVDYRTSDVTAAAGGDYTAAAGTLVFAAGTASGSTQTVTVPVLEDALDEATETFALTLSQPVGAVLGTAQHTVSIQDNDPTPDLSVADVAVFEGDAGSTLARFTVSLSTASGQAVSVTYGTADGTALAGSDYLPATGTLTFAPGVTGQQVAVSVLGDTVREPNESFLLNLYNPVNAGLADGQGRGVILTDETEAAAWRDPVNVSVSGNGISKTGAPGWNASAVSTKALAAGDGFLEFTAPAYSDRVLGFGYADNGAGYTDVAFGLWLTDGGSVYLAEGGQLTSTYLDSYLAGDRFRVSIELGVVRYYHGGRLIFTSTRPPVYPMWVDGSLYHTGAAVAGVVLAGAWQTEEATAWTRPVGVSVSRNSLAKTGGAGWNAGAASVKALLSGDGFIEFTAGGTGDRAVGFGYADTGGSYADIAFGLEVTGGGTVYAVEGGQITSTSLGPASPGDRFRVAIEAGAVKYYRNQAPIGTGTTVPSYPLWVETSIYSTGGTVGDVAMAGAWEQRDGAVWTRPVEVTVSRNSLAKTGPIGWNAGAATTTALTSGDGAIEFTGGGMSDRIVGFGYADTGAGYADVAFGLWLTDGGNLYVVEGGQLTDTYVGPYTSGDRFRVAVESGVVRYYQKGRLLYTSTRAPAYPMWADTSIYSMAGTVGGLVTAGRWEPRDGVVWTRPVGLAIAGSRITKTAGSGWNAGAISTAVLPAGNGALEFTAEGLADRIGGLGNADTGGGYADIAFGLWLSGGGYVYLVEGGQLVGTVLGPYMSGDRFRLAVAGGVVTYSRNGTLLYTSTRVPSYPLRADASLYQTGAVLGTVTLDGGWQAQGGVTWAAPVGLSVAWNGLTKTATTAGWNAGAASVNLLSSGDGDLEFTAQGLSDRVAGLANTDAGSSYTDIAFGLDLTDGGNVYLLENGQLGSGPLGTYASGDRFRVELRSGVVRYYRNGNLVYTSTRTPSYPLRVDTSFYRTGAALRTLVLSGNWQLP